MTNRSGYLKKNLSGDASYTSFTPALLPPEPTISLDRDGIKLLVEANKRLALLDGLSSRIPNVNLFISMYVRKEALMSSQIEGTQATLEDILDPMINENANLNIAEVVNYIKAIEFAIDRLNSLPLCNRLIREAHAILMENARGQERTPGEFRRSQNWIGGIGSNIKTARYVPPAPEDMQDAMYGLEHYMNNSEPPGELDILIQTALIHYQFETIHPFLDGNGRIGRLLVTLFLMEKKALSSPVLYISYSLKQNRIEYYDRMMLVREKGEYEQWVQFFLKAILDSTNDAIDTIDRLTILHDKNISLIQKTGRSTKTLKKVFRYLEENPIIEIQKTAATLGISFNTVSNAINKLCDLGILNQTNKAQRNRIFAYESYLDILRSGT
ncbi:MAG: Fic family protein [Defluviitaleaceae bacterium]|nr:Fic family protein [Defluviitaleaceae bacterium]